MSSGSRMVRTVVDYLPKGQSLPEDVWRVRHRTLSYLLRAHVVGIFVFAVVQGFGLAHATFEASIIAAFAVLATVTSSRKLSSGATAVGLVASSAVIVHLSGGIIEMHFHFFVMVGILTLYQDWLPFLSAIVFVVLHHGTMGALRPEDVYNHPDAVAHPFRWALVHGGFVLAASAASVIAWRLNEEQALKDPLTGLPNRRLFQDRVGHALARTQRLQSTVAVLFVDLDGFKDVNDSLGHAAGDQLLNAVAERLRASLRPGDTAARLGGDEFAILVEDLRAEDDALQVADRILAALTVPFAVRGKEIVVGASIGIALARPGDTADEVLRNADVAMYTVKSGGRGRREVFETAMHAAVVERVQLEQDMHRAVEDGEFVLHYQPVISLATGRIASLEALIRWQHPTRGLLAPMEFLPAAEQTGAIVAIGTWVLNEACKQAVAWKERFRDRPFTISINLSVSQLVQPNLVELVKQALASSGLQPSDLVLELTESVMVDDTTTTVSRLHELKALGVQLAVDDFGTGYSSLSYLRRLPIDILKIDKMFIDSIADGPTEAEFARSIISLAHTLHLETIAEGVEEPDQVDCLRDLGCNLAQGYRFARPLDINGIAALFGAAEVSEGWLSNRP